MTLVQASANRGASRAAVPLYLATALIVTAAIVILQVAMRGGTVKVETVSIFYHLFLFEDFPAGFLYVAVLLAGLVPELQRAGIRAARWIGARPVLVAVLAGCALAVAALFVYRAQPVAMDESVPLMQSRIFAAGALVGQFPPALIDWLIYPPFQGYFIKVSGETGKIASAYWPGFALLLTPFALAGVPWMCNPVLGGLSVWVIHRLALALTGSVQAAGAAVLLSLASAAFTVNSFSYYSMTAHLLCNAVFVLLLLEPSPSRAVMAGLTGGLALTLHNPLPHMLFAAPWLLWIASRPGRWRLLAAMSIGYLPWVTVVGFGWHQLLQTLAIDAMHAGRAGGVLHDALRTFARVFHLPGATQLIDRIVGLAKLWLWGAPAIVLFAMAGAWRVRGDSRYRLLIASALLTFAGFLFVPLSQGHGWGFRYFHSAWFVLPLLAAAAVMPVAGRRAADAEAGAGSPGGYAHAVALGGLLVVSPFFFWSVGGFVDSHQGQLPRATRGQPRVVIIDTTRGYYTEDLVQNDPFLRDPVIRMASRGEHADREMLARFFPDLVQLSESARGAVWGQRDDPGEGAPAARSAGNPEY